MKQNVCNICGANYEYRNGRWVCPACGAYKTEELSNEEVTLLYTAAQKLRIGDFSEAENEYSDIVSKYPKNSSGYWGRLLSRYGIKYEEDFDGRKIPTCYATSIESVLHDKDYLKALELADKDSKKYYTEQAGYIERVRKEWVERAKKEKPYDIFICYKDSDLPNGIGRTKDSIAAQELYIHLTEQGYRVFFSRESLRDKVGEKYEPYIFNALSTAKVMLVYGSSAEYITSTWLKNEWTRYEKRLQAGEKKPNSLIVACDGFSPSELPSALSSMQCMDATKRTFYSDLDAQIKRIIKGEEKPKPAPIEKPQKKSKKLPIAISIVSILIAVVLCILIPNMLNNNPTSSIIDSKYGVVVSADSKMFDKNTSLVVDRMTDGTQYSSLISAVNNTKEIDIQNAVIYDIECDAEITDNVTIKVAYAKNKADTTVKVYYISDDKSQVEEHTCTYENGFVTFKTPHLSYYLIGEVTSGTNPPSVTPSDNLTLEQGVLTVGVCANYEPYEYVEDGKFKGIEIDILKAIGTDVGLRVEFKNYAFEDLLTNLTDNKLDCIIGVTQTVQRDEQALATKPMFSEEDTEYIIYVNKSNSKLKETLNSSIDSLNASSSIDTIVNTYKNESVSTHTTIIFQATGGEGTMENQLIPHNTSAALSKCLFTKDGYTFKGWAKSASSAVAEYTDESSFSVTSSGTIILYAVWEKNQETLTQVVGVFFESNGGTGTMKSLTVEAKGSFTFPACEFTRDGYTFKGWSKDTSGLYTVYNVGDAYSVYTSSETFYAAWIPNENTIVFNVNGGEGTMDVQKIPTGTTRNLTACNFTRDGYIFAGWSTEPNGTVEYNDAASYTMGTTSENTLYAIWSKNDYKITYHLYNGKNNASNPNGFDVTTETIVLKAPTKDGHTFKGWFKESSFTTEITNIPKGSLENVEVYAKWEANKYNITLDDVEQIQGSATITFDKNYSGSVSDTVVLQGGDVLSYPTPPTREGFIFTGWYTNSTCTTRYDFTGEITLSMTLYAGWKETVLPDDTYTYSSTNINPYNYNSASNAYDVPALGGVTKSNYVYLVANENGSHTIHFKNLSSKVDQWTRIAIINATTNQSLRDFTAYTSEYYDEVVFNCNAGDVIEIIVRQDSMSTWYGTASFYFEGFSVPESSAKAELPRTGLGYNENSNYVEQVTFGESYTLPTPYRLGYTFDGWYDSSDNKASSGVWNIASNVTYTAKWKANTDTPYVVNHYKQNLNSSEYSLANTQNLTGTSDSSISPATNTYTGFVTPTKQTVSINADGSLVVNYYYMRNTYTVVLSVNGGDELANQTYQYEQMLSLPTPSRAGYTFGGWFSNEELTTAAQSVSITSDMQFYAWWTEENKPSDFDYAKSGTRITIYEYLSDNPTMVIPSYIGGLPVKTIVASAFKDNTIIATAILPEHLSAISDNMFENCTSLTEIKNYGAVSSIGKYAFSGCTSLKKFNSSKDYELIINDGVNTIGTYAFKNVSLVQKIVVPNSVTRINEAAFNGCNGLKDLTIPFVGRERSNTTYYNNLGYIFSEEYRYTEPENSIRQDTYDSYHFPFIIPLGIERITVTDTKLIGRGAFQNMDFVRSITISCAIEEIDCSAFLGLTTSTTIIYDGTMDEWKQIEKYTAPSANWGGQYLNFSCSDGTVTGG